MKRWNYDELADSEPDGNSEWCNAKEMDKEIKQLKKILKEAYSEGWHDCYDHLEEYTIINDWNKSKLKINIEKH